MDRDEMLNVLAYWAIAPRSYPRGVLRFRSLEEAQLARRRVTLDGDLRTRPVDSDLAVEAKKPDVPKL